MYMEHIFSTKILQGEIAYSWELEDCTESWIKVVHWHVLDQNSATKSVVSKCLGYWNMKVQAKTLLPTDICCQENLTNTSIRKKIL